MEPFRTDLYRGTAPFYDRYRPPYPQPLFDDLRRRVPVSGKGRLLDPGCGTGQITIPLAPSFAEVVAVDQEAESVAFGRSKATSLGLSNILWTAGSVESADIVGPFELIAVGNAFHRFDRTAVAERMFSWAGPGGAVALLWSDAASGRSAPWQRALETVIADWVDKMGAASRVPAGWEEARRNEPDALVLEQAGFDYVDKFEFAIDHTWTVETLAGFMYSTSVLNRGVLGDNVSEFEDDLARRLAPHSTDGGFHQTISYAYELARKPA